MTLLRTEKLTIGYAQGHALQRDLNVSLAKGEIVALMGQNGVGKTTFLKTVGGFLPALSGEVYLDDQPLLQMDRQTLAQKVSVVLTEKPPSIPLTVYELIAMGRHPYSNWLGLLSTTDKACISEAIHQTQIDYLADRSVSTLSDGQWQKVMIARALAQDTDLILLDEPVAHLDLNNKIEILLMLREIAQQGKAILISTHDIQVTTQICHKLWLFDFGHQFISGLPEDLILQGQLEKVLYLEKHPYDLVHHRLIHQPKGRVVTLSGEGPITYWTEQALTRAGFQIGDSALSIACTPTTWKVHGTTSAEVHSLADLIAFLNQ